VAKLPVVSGNVCIIALQRLGYKVNHISGSHAWLVCPGRNPLPVPKHRELGPGLLRKILNEADISVDEFIKLLKQ
jgi:predicted RNA binding protein YcfA (HicA-like mRNA interferase family)